MKSSDEGDRLLRRKRPFGITSHKHKRPDPALDEVAAWAAEAGLELTPGALQALAYYMAPFQATMRHGTQEVRLRFIRRCWKNIEGELPSG